MDFTKIRLSAKEKDLLSNADWILTKNEILEKCVVLLAHLQPLQETIIQSSLSKLPEPWINAKPKISKGENYLGLPYRLLDHPAFFNKENIAAIRTMCWWGNFFSVTLHLSGSYKQQYQQKILDKHSSLSNTDLFICISDDQWQHHFGSNNYLLVKDMTVDEFEKQITNKPFIKLALKLPLDIWNNANEELLTAFKTILKIIED